MVVMLVMLAIYIGYQGNFGRLYIGGARVGCVGKVRDVLGGVGRLCYRVGSFKVGTVVDVN